MKYKLKLFARKYEIKLYFSYKKQTNSKWKIVYPTDRPNKEVQ